MNRVAFRVSLLTASLLFTGMASAGAAVTPLRQAELIHLLKHDCGSCHGITLRGGLGSPLTPTALAGKSPEVLEDIIIHGIPGQPMPPWKGLLSQEEIQWLVEQMRKGLEP